MMILQSHRTLSVFSPNALSHMLLRYTLYIPGLVSCAVSPATYYVARRPLPGPSQTKVSVPFCVVAALTVRSALCLVMSEHELHDL